MEERAKLLHDTIAAQRRFLAEQRAIAIRNKPPTRTQMIKEMNKRVKDSDQKSLKKRVVEETPKKDDTTEVPAKQDVSRAGYKEEKMWSYKDDCKEKAKTKVRILQKSQENGQNRTITDTGMKRVYKSRENAIKGLTWQSYTSPNAPIGGNPKGNDTRAKEKTYLSRGICTKRHEKEAQWL
ncbi:hypothetical protein Tco_1006173 [Tanacetum coccineum]|uniref:Uncharacterized protein n=1 Tax=Tanacetum coccineum TaxID=301880 RepID=A0ABQ5FI46_9ASTR